MNKTKEKTTGNGKGYVLISRGLLEHKRFKPEGAMTKFEAWYWLIEKAAYVPRTVTVINGRHHAAVPLLPGQLTYSVRYLAGAWKWSDKRVQRFLAALESDGSISTKTTSGQTVFTLLNWAKYQRPNAEISADQATTQTATQTAGATTTQTQVITTCEIKAFSSGKIEATTQTEAPTTTQTATNKKERKKSKKDIAPCGSDFADWYSIYPKKKSPQDAKRAFDKIISSDLIALSDLMEKTRAFAATWASEPKERRKYIPYPAKWLRDGGYDDEPEGGEPASAPIDPRAFTDTEWQKRLTHFRDNAQWLEIWGAKPGKPGCLVPAHLLLSPVSTSKGAA
jgi:hypothetical protein